MCDKCTRDAMLPLVSLLAAALAEQGVRDAEPTFSSIHQICEAMMPPDLGERPEDRIERARWNRVRAEYLETATNAVDQLYLALSTEALLDLGQTAQELCGIFRVMENNARAYLVERAEKGDTLAQQRLAPRKSGMEVHVLDLSALFGSENTGKAEQAPH
jgi:hypothetical protein